MAPRHGRTPGAPEHAPRGAAVPMPRPPRRSSVEHNFAGPRYTVGVEEELMILDAGTLDLANEIDAIIGEDPPRGRSSAS